MPSGINPADPPSRRLSVADAKLSQASWEKIENWFGPHTFDLMALDSNVRLDKNGKALPHYSPWPLPQSSGVNVFAQFLKSSENYYCFPPSCLTGSVLAFFLNECSRPLQVTLLAQNSSPPAPWWPKLVANVSALHLLAKKGESGIIEIPCKMGFVPTTVQHELWVGRLRLD